MLKDDKKKKKTEATRVTLKKLEKSPQKWEQMLDDKKKPEQTQLNFNNSRSKIWDRNNLTKKKSEHITKLKAQ